MILLFFVLLLIVAWLVLPFTIAYRLNKILREAKAQTAELELITAYTKRAAQAADPNFKPAPPKGGRWITGV